MKIDITMITMYVMYFVLFRVTSGGFDTMMYNSLFWKMNKQFKQKSCNLSQEIRGHKDQVKTLGLRHCDNYICKIQIF